MCLWVPNCLGGGRIAVIFAKSYIFVTEVLTSCLGQYLKAREADWACVLSEMGSLSAENEPSQLHSDH